MEKIRLGKSELMVSRIGFGGIPIQRVSEDEAVAVVNKCLELGINYLDTANAYSTSEERIGKAIAGKRDQVILATKSQGRTADEVKPHLELSLKRFAVDYIDVYQLHNVADMDTLEKVLGPDGPLSMLEDAKKAGIIKHISITSHQVDAAKAAVKSGRFETIMFPFNFIAFEPALELLELTREHDVGFIAMKPLAGGMLNNVNLAFKYLLQFPHVLPIPGIEKVQEIEEIVALAKKSKPITKAEQQEMEQMRKELGTRFCRRCDYCQPCTAEIPISMVMGFPVLFKHLSREELLSGWFAGFMEKATGCTECGECEERCPYDLPIREMMAEYVRIYQAEKKKGQ